MTTDWMTVRPPGSHSISVPIVAARTNWGAVSFDIFALSLLLLPLKRGNISQYFFFSSIPPACMCSLSHSANCFHLLVCHLLIRSPTCSKQREIHVLCLVSLASCRVSVQKESQILLLPSRECCSLWLVFSCVLYEVTPRCYLAVYV